MQPYRGEGFGLPILEAMACGLPVIVTGAGPATEYCGDETSYLLPATEVPVPDAVWPPSLPTGHPPTWYEPDLGVLRRVMRHVHEHPDEARRKGALASARVSRDDTWASTVGRMRGRLARYARGAGPRGPTSAGG